tara:strand:- start:866 stop:1984 length:1119 start_codon:yes stop_codon:yes gene_type:complete
MIKKIGLLNFHYSNNNYGAVLQATALNKAVEMLGYQVETIDFIPEFRVQPKTFKNMVGALLRMLGLREKTAKLKPMENDYIFEGFRSDWLPRSAGEFHNFEDLKTIDTDYSVVIVGSDQVWRPAMTLDFALAYFLSFVPESCRRVSYAASFGVDYWQGKNISTATSDVVKELKKFHSVSVREDSGVDICKNVFNVKAEHVLDPTLLIGRLFFEEIIEHGQNHSKPLDIVYYKLDVDSVFLDELKQVESQLNYRSEDIYYTHVDGKYFFTPVAEWLMKLRDCKLIISDSFHCICFAIIFEKEFIYYPNAKRGMSRLESLLNSIGLENRICRDQRLLNNLKENYLAKPIDYIDVNRKLEERRHSSFTFLKNALS